MRVSFTRRLRQRGSEAGATDTSVGALARSWTNHPNPGWRWTHEMPVIANPFLRLVLGPMRRVRIWRHRRRLLDLLAAFTARPAAPARGRPPRLARRACSPAFVLASRNERSGRRAPRRVHPVYPAAELPAGFGSESVKSFAGFASARQRRRSRRAAARCRMSPMPGGSPTSHILPRVPPHGAYSRTLSRHGDLRSRRGSIVRRSTSANMTRRGFVDSVFTPGSCILSDDQKSSNGMYQPLTLSVFSVACCSLCHVHRVREPARKRTARARRRIRFGAIAREP